MVRKIARILAALCALTLLAGTMFAQAADSKQGASPSASNTKSSKTPKSKLVDINSASKEALGALPDGGDAHSQTVHYYHASISRHRRQPVQANLTPGPRGGRGGDQVLPAGRPRHQAGRGGHRVAPHGVIQAAGRAAVARGGNSGVHADTHPQ